MEKHFYIGEGPGNDAIIKEIDELFEQCKAARAKLARDFKADTVWTRKQRVCGLVFRRRQQLPWLNLVRANGNFYAYSPQQSTAKGWELARRIREEDILYFDPSVYVLERLLLQRTVVDMGHTYKSQAGITNRQIFVSIPGGKKHIAGSDPFPTIPGWLYEVPANEWLVAQGREVA